MVSVPGPTGQRRAQRRTTRSGKMRRHACHHPDHAFCAEPHGRAAPGQRPHGAVQLARRARVGRSFRAARRGYRCRPQPGRAARASTRRAALAGNQLGRRSGRGRSTRSVSPERTQFHLRQGARDARGERPDIPVLLLARRTATLAQDPTCRGQATAVCAHLRGLEPGRGAATHRFRQGAGDPLPRARSSHHRVPGSCPRSAALPVRRHRRLRDPSCRRQRVVLPGQCGGRLRDGYHARIAG